MHENIFNVNDDVGKDVNGITNTIIISSLSIISCPPISGVSLVLYSDNLGLEYVLCKSNLQDWHFAIISAEKPYLFFRPDHKLFYYYTHSTTGLKSEHSVIGNGKIYIS